MTTPPLPEIADPGRLTEALRRSGALGAGHVADVAVEAAFSTLLSRITRLRPTYEGPADGAPAALVVKAALPDAPSRLWEAGRQEVAFYREVAAATPAGLVPRCFDAAWDKESGAWHLLLEDLTATHEAATRWPLPPTLAQAEAITRARARFQAAWWDDPRLGASIGAWHDMAATEQATQRLATQYAGFAEVLGDRLSPARRDLHARLLDAAPRLATRYHAHRDMTIIQGDAHVWNCFLPRAAGSEDARLFDWDGWRVDVGTDDLAYMMAVHWYPEFRRGAERHLLDCHHAALLAAGVTGYDRHALQEDYRLSVLWQIMTPVWQQANGIPPVIWWNNMERIHLAAEDLGCRTLLAG